MSEPIWGHRARKIKLFCILPLYSYKENIKKKEWRLLGLPVFVIRRHNPVGKSRIYYLLGCIRILKVIQHNK